MKSNLISRGLTALLFLAVCSPSVVTVAGRQDSLPAVPQSAAGIESQVVQSVCDKRVVLLAELPSHGEGRAFQAKAEIVRRLVAQCGFKVVLFEAPIYEFFGLQDALVDGRAELAHLDRAIGGFWTTDGLRDWRRWLLDQAARSDLSIGGIDDQVSATSEYARATLPDLTGRLVPDAQSQTCREAVDRNLFWRYDSVHTFDDEEAGRLAQCARQAADAAAVREVDVKVRAMADNLASLYVRQATGNDPMARDAAMARNVRWQTEQFPLAKVVVWTATVHAARGKTARGLPLGARLADALGDQLASIGFTAFSGQSSMAGRPAKVIPTAPPGSLEAVATASGLDRVYLDAAALRRLGPVSARLFGTFATDDWSRHFDGVVVIREEIAPTFSSGGHEAQWARPCS